jgi:PAS domain S-box-containing protein
LNPWPHVEIVVYGIVLVAIPIGWSYFNQAYFSLQPLALQTVIENLEDGIFVFDANDRAIYFNEAGARLLDTDSISADDIQPVETLFVNRPALLEGYYSEKSGSGHPPDRQTEATDSPLAIGADSETRYCDIEFSAIRNSVNERIGTVLVVRDVTDTHQKRQKLRERTAELERQNERLEMFAGTVSHDLQNPLHTAQGYLELARETNRETHFERVEQSLDRMSGIIDDLLRLARIEMTAEETEQVSVPVLVMDVWETLGVNEATLEMDIPTETTIQADRGLLQNLFENLFRNAIEHNEQPVTSTVGTLDGDGLYIADDGKGSPPENPEMIFEQGYTTDSDSLGFGLSIVEEIADAHGWEIHITDSANGGARFEITGVESMAG